MPEVLLTGDGLGYTAKIDKSGALFTVGSIVSMPSITLGSVDVQIGAVEIRDQGSDNRATVAGSALFVFGTTGSFFYNSVSSITSGADSAIGSVVSTGSFYLLGWEAGGTAEAKFRLKRGATVMSTLRNSTAQRYISRDFMYPVHFNSGTVITVTGEHGETLSQNFEATLWYKLI